MSRLPILAVILLASGCGLLGPAIECRDIARDPCMHAVEIATGNIEGRVGPTSWFEAKGPARIVVALGCGLREGGCPPALSSGFVTVSFFSGIEGDEAIHASVPRSDLGIPDA